MSATGGRGGDWGLHPDTVVSERSEHDELMTVFGYYAGIAAVQFPATVADLLVASGYRDPRQVLEELAAWCYANRVDT